MKFDFSSSASDKYHLWGHISYIMPALHLLILFPSTSSRGADRSLLSPLSERSPGPAHSSKPNQLQGGEFQLPAHLTKETSSQFKLYKPLSRDVTSFRRTSSPQRSCKAQQNHEGHTTGKDDFTELRTAQQTLFPLLMDGNTTRLIINTDMRLSKTVYRFYVMFINVNCDVVIFWL